MSGGTDGISIVENPTPLQHRKLSISMEAGSIPNNPRLSTELIVHKSNTHHDIRQQLTLYLDDELSRLNFRESLKKSLDDEPTTLSLKTEMERFIENPISTPAEI